MKIDVLRLLCVFLMATAAPLPPQVHAIGLNQPAPPAQPDDDDDDNGGETQSVGGNICALPSVTAARKSVWRYCGPSPSGAEIGERCKCQRGEDGTVRPN